MPYSSDESGKKALLDEAQIQTLLKQCSGWQLTTEKNSIERTYQFNNFHATMDFVRKIEAIIHAEDHHPTMTINYSSCALEYSTHSVEGLTLNDFICVAKINQVYESATI
jgi:4a-hydroxytetrahydrobiopterin dehydratase